MVVGVVDVQHVGPLQAEPVQALRVGPQHPLGAEVPDWHDVCRLGPDGIVPVAGVGGGLPATGPDKPATDLCGDGELRAGFAGQYPARAPLGEPAAVQRRGVEVSEAEFPGLLDGGVRLPVADLPVEPGERGEPEAEPGHLHVRPAQPDPISGIHAASPSPAGGRSGPVPAWINRMIAWLIRA